VYDKATTISRTIPLSEPICTIMPGINADYKLDTVRFSSTSPLTPETTYDYNMKKAVLSTLRSLPVIGHPTFAREDYICSREMVESGDTMIPLTLIYNKHIRADSK
jgi:oligopeptidase B